MSSSSNEPIHIVEPTLRDEAGHCHSLIASLAACPQRPPLVVWADKQIQLPHLASQPALTLKAYFSRRLRRLQAYFLYRRLLRQTGNIFISTASRTDLQLMDWAAGKQSYPGKLFFYVHWLGISEKKMHALKRIAQRRPEFCLLATTQSVADKLRACGFALVKQIPYPVTASAVPAEQSGFQHVLFAGAARQDKGFSQLIDYIEFLNKSAASLPVSVQTSAEHYGKQDAAIQREIMRLDAIDYEPLIRQRDTLTAEAYHALYRGAICLQPYDPLEFADRVSGVTLDALRAGAPVIVTDHTWMARIIQRFDAGVVLPDRSVQSIHAAVEKIRSHYAEYQTNARRAGQALERENSAQHLMNALTGKE
jgi:glycosyltransferase involved in cell wall biosynthesis